MKHYLYGAVILGLAAFAWWYGATMKQAGIDETEARYIKAQQEGLLLTLERHKEILAADQKVVLEKAAKAEQRSALLSQRLRQAENTVNELRKSNVCNISLGTVRLLNDLGRQYRSEPASESIPDEAAGQLTRVTGAAFEQWVISVVEQYYGVADQLIALQSEIRNRVQYAGKR